MMISMATKNAADLRSIAAQLRRSADETDFNIYRRKFESVARELEEAALDAESRTLAGKRGMPDC
jgi:hypothetical protein